MLQGARGAAAGIRHRWRSGVVAAALVLPGGVLAAQTPRPADTPQRPQRITVVGTGPSNSITDVPNLKVGSYTRSDSGYRTGTTVIVATHDKQMVDRMRRRVIELAGGHVIRDEATGSYST